MTNWETIELDISTKLGITFKNSHASSVGGGCINTAFILKSGSTHVFVKLNDAAREDMFAAEAEGLQEIIQSNSLRAPQPLCWGRSQNQSYIAMEYISLAGRQSEAIVQLGRGLAAMHRCTAKLFGWQRDNTIGSTLQPNPQNPDWVNFYKQQRLGFQLKLAEQSGCHRKLLAKGERLLADLDAFFTSYTPEASLLHGDLWSGNYAISTTGMPVIFDPAVYFGDREADMAMTELFGGFPSDFYSAYNEAYALDSGYPVRKTLYNLYHILNHYNLFGGGYIGQAEHMIDSLLAELR